MQSNHKNDQLISTLLQKSKLEMPFSDFEEMVMLRIQEESLQEVVVTRDRKLSVFFFVLGTSLGLILNTILGRSKNTIFNISPDTILLVFQVGFVLLFLIQFDKIFPLIKQWKAQRQKV